MKDITKRLIFGMVYVAATSAIADIVPTTLKDMVDTNMLYTAAQVDQMIAESTDLHGYEAVSNAAMNAMQQYRFRNVSFQYAGLSHDSFPIRYTDEQGEHSLGEDDISYGILGTSLRVYLKGTSHQQWLFSLWKVADSSAVYAFSAASVSNLTFNGQSPIQGKFPQYYNSSSTLFLEPFKNNVLTRAEGYYIWYGDVWVDSEFPPAATNAPMRDLYLTIDDTANTNTTTNFYIDWNKGNVDKFTLGDWEANQPKRGGVTLYRISEYLPNHFCASLETFTDEQWNAITSGIDADKVAKLDALPTKAELDYRFEALSLEDKYCDSSVTNLAQITTNGLTFTYNNSTFTAVVTGYAGNDSEVVIPWRTENGGIEYSVVAIGNGAFADNETIRSVVAPITVVDIGEDAFAIDETSGAVSQLEKVSACGAETIGSRAFEGCESLRSLSISKAMQVGDSAASYCTSLESIYLPAVTNIGTYAFASCTALKSAYLPLSETISEGAFSECESLEEVSIDSATALYDDVFTYCTSLEHLYLPHVNSIGWYTLEETAIKTLDFGNQMTTVPTLETELFPGQEIVDCTIIVPDALYEVWIAAENWAEVKSRGNLFLRHSDWEYARRYEIAGKADEIIPVASIKTLPDDCFPIQFTKEGVVTTLQSRDDTRIDLVGPHQIPMLYTASGSDVICQFNYTDGTFANASSQVSAITFGGTEPTANEWPAIITIRQGGEVVRTTDLENYAPLASPAFTGVPTAPDPLTGASSNQIANIGYVKQAVDETSPLVARSFTVPASTGSKNFAAIEKIVFRPRYFGMNGGDRIKSITVETTEGGSSPTAYDNLHARIHRLSDDGIIGVSEGISTTTDKGVYYTFPFRESVALESPDTSEKYYIDFSTTRDGTSIAYRLEIYVRSQSNDEYYVYQYPSWAPVLEVRYYSWESDLATTNDVTLTERDGFSEWTIDPPSYGGDTLSVGIWKNPVSGKDYFCFYLGDTIVNSMVALVEHNPTTINGQIASGGVTATATRTALQGYTLGSQTDKPLASEAEAATNRAAISTLTTTKADKSALDPLLFAQYYPEGNVKSAAEFTSDIKYDAPNTTARTITVKPFCYTGYAPDDNSNLSGHVVIPPFVDAQGNPYISDNGTRYKVVGVSFGSPHGSNTNLTVIVVPTTVTSIEENNAFFRCTSLTSISLPAATSIGLSAFYNCSSLTSVSLPAATTIGDTAFVGCSSLVSVDFGDTPRSSVPTLGSNVFNGVPTSCKIIVPDEQYDAWTAASGWSDLVQAGYKFLRHSEWEYARKCELAVRAGDGLDSAVQVQSSPTPVVAGSFNTAISQSSMVEGSSNFAGLNGYRYTNTGIVSNSLTFAIVPDGWAIDDVVSVVNKSKYPDCATIASISGNTVTFTENLPFTNIVEETDWDSNVAYVSEKPDKGNVDLGYGAHAEGVGTKALNAMSHAEGRETKALGQYSHAEGRETQAQYTAHAEGQSTKASGTRSHAEGYDTTSSGNGSHAEGQHTRAAGQASHVEGHSGIAVTDATVNKNADGIIADWEQQKFSLAKGTASHVEGKDNLGLGEYSHAEGLQTTALGPRAHAEGSGTSATGDNAHAEGSGSEACANSAHAEGVNTVAGNGTRPSVNTNTAEGNFSHAEGNGTFAKGNSSHAEGKSTQALKPYSHAEGLNTTADGNKSHAEGWQTNAAGEDSHAEGGNTQTSNRYEHAQGTYNKSNTGGTNFGNAGNTIHSIGIGTSNGRKNAVEVMQDGKVFVKDIGGYVGTNPTGQTNAAQDLATVVNEKASTADATLTPVYGGNGEKFSVWSFSGSGVDPSVSYSVYISENESSSTGYVATLSDDIYNLEDAEVQNEDVRQIEFVDYNIIATRTENPILGYTLGDQTDKPLQPKGDYATTNLVNERIYDIQLEVSERPTMSEVMSLDMSYRHFGEVTNVNQSVQVVTNVQNGILAIDVPTGDDATKDWIVYAFLDTAAALSLPQNVLWYASKSDTTNEIPANVLTAFYFSQISGNAYTFARKQMTPALLGTENKEYAKVIDNGAKLEYAPSVIAPILDIPTEAAYNEKGYYYVDLSPSNTTMQVTNMVYFVTNNLERTYIDVEYFYANPVTEADSTQTQQRGENDPEADIPLLGLLAMENSPRKRREAAYRRMAGFRKRAD
jgi:hypothetical protein